MHLSLLIFAFNLYVDVWRYSYFNKLDYLLNNNKYNLICDSLTSESQENFISNSKGLYSTTKCFNGLMFNKFSSDAVPSVNMRVRPIVHGIDKEKLLSNVHWFNIKHTFDVNFLVLHNISRTYELE